MLAAAIHKTAPFLANLGFNWFDVTLAIVVGIGFYRGRRRGMTKEMLPALEWLAIVLVAGFGHTFLADWFQQQGLVKQVFGHRFTERTAALMSAYLLIAVILFVVFSLLKRKYNPQLEGSNVFGGSEYYWGVLAGCIRYVCLVLVALALLNAPSYSAADIKATEAYNNRWYGGGLKDYKGNFIPTVYEVQDSVFKESRVGPLIKANLSPLLINTTPPAAGKKNAQS